MSIKTITSNSLVVWALADKKTGVLAEVYTSRDAAREEKLTTEKVVKLSARLA